LKKTTINCQSKKATPGKKQTEQSTCAKKKEKQSAAGPKTKPLLLDVAPRRRKEKGKQQFRCLAMVWVSQCSTLVMPWSDPQPKNRKNNKPALKIQ